MRGRRRRADDARREPRPGGARRRSPTRAGRDVAPRRAAPVEQGTRALETFDVDRVGRLASSSPSGWTGSPARSGPAARVPGPAPGQRRRRPGEGRLRARRPRGAASAARGCDALERARADDGRPAGRRRRRPRGRRSRPARARRSGCARAGRAPRAGPVDGHERRLRGRRSRRARRSSASVGRCSASAHAPRAQHGRSRRLSAAIGRVWAALVDSGRGRVRPATSSRSLFLAVWLLVLGRVLLSWVDPAGRDQVSARS